ncbi:MAG TPA: FtsX-like permease family protein [Mycobacteriales bacterium]|nr:FtsX-like permease family protein [Mycobacteriales bacterium]
MTGAVTLLRGLWHRAGTSLVIFVVALCATAAAAVGPTYYAAARDSILQDALTSPGVITRGFQLSSSGVLAGSSGNLAGLANDELDRTLGEARADRLFQPPIQALEGADFFPKLVENVALVWRSDVCRHLTLRTGRCPTQANEVLVSASLAADNQWQVGQVVKGNQPAPLTIVGIYRVPNTQLDYWFARGAAYFPAEIATALPTPPYDAMFTPRSTLEQLKGSPQGSAVYVRVLNAARVTPGDLDPIVRATQHMSTSRTLLANQVTVTTGIPATGDDVHSSWSALAVPVLVVTAELLVLTWLLLFLVVTDAVDARGTEIALAKLRGYGAARAMLFGLGEPAVLLLLALPVGAVVGWLLSDALTHVLLRPGTPVPLPALGWVAAVVAVAGGAAAVVVGGRRTVVRPVVEQWRRTGRRANDRGWVFDAVVLTAAVAGFAQLFLSGTLSSASQSALALLVPGLLGLAIAVVASRLLPLICRSLFARTRSRGDLGAFLAVRHIARRPGGTRTTMILATAVALATFSMGSWIVGDANRARIAQIGVGAPTVLNVALPTDVDLAKVVDRIDPAGRSATAVMSFNNGTVTLLGVEPARFARIASWSAGRVSDPATLLNDLDPPAPDPIVLNGDRVRLRLSSISIQPEPVAVVLDVAASGSAAPTPVEMGTLRSGRTATLTGELAGCPCIVNDIQVTPPGGRIGALDGHLTVDGLDEGANGRWQPLAGFAGAGHWRGLDNGRKFVRATQSTVAWQFVSQPSSPATLGVVDRPPALPAVVSTALEQSDTAIAVSGLDAQGLDITPVDSAPGVPGAAANGVVVSLRYAVRAATNDTAPATAQVWLRGDADRVRHALVAAGVPVISEISSSDVASEFGRQGPGLASVLFLADAAAAAVLAALAAVLSLSAAARRRRYEYAALAAAGASRRSLYSALAIEQVVVIGFGALAGIGAGLLASVLAGRNVPEFVHPPDSTLLGYFPSPLFMGVVLGAGFVFLVAVAAVAAATLLRTVTPEQLREAPL